MNAQIDSLVAWSPWVPFTVAAAEAPLVPGVYMARTGEEGPIVYIGMAGERRGRGLRGRLAVYASGKGAVSGLGEAAFNRALADPVWVAQRLTELEAGEARRATSWARAAIDRADLRVRWACVADRPAAVVLERRVIATLHGMPLWNVRRSLPG